MPPDTDPISTDTAIVIDQNLGEPIGKIVFTCQVKGDEVCMMNADGSGWQRLTNSPSANYYGSLSQDGQSVFLSGKKQAIPRFMKYSLTRERSGN